MLVRKKLVKVSAMFRSECLSRTTWVVWFICSALLVIAGPFGTFAQMTITERLLFWPLLVAMSIFLSYGVRALVHTLAADKARLSRDAMVLFLFSALFAPMPTVFSIVMTGGRDVPLMGGIEAFFAVLVISSALIIIRNVLGLEKDAPGEDMPDLPRFLRRLEGDVRPEEVLRLTVDDHYVEIFFASGSSQRVLIRFADAVEEMDGLEGMCVHRSHWVASQAIEGVERCGGKEFVVLSDGSRIPVSRTYRPNLVEAGWIVDRRLKAAGQAMAAAPSAQQSPFPRSRS